MRLRAVGRPLVSKDVYDAAQPKLASNPSRPVSKQVSLKNPLSGLIICGSCAETWYVDHNAKAKLRRRFDLILPAIQSGLSSVVEDELLYALRQCYSELSSQKSCRARS